MRLELTTIIQRIISLRIPEDIFFLQNEIRRIAYCRDQLKISLRDLGNELRKFEIDTLSKDDELLFSALTEHLTELIKEIYSCGPTYYGSHNELYGGSMAGFKKGVNDGLHCWLQYPLEFLKNTALSVADESTENELLSKVMALKILLEHYNRSLIAAARFKPITSSQAQSVPSRTLSIRPFFATKKASEQASHVHGTQGKKGLNPDAQEFLPQFTANTKSTPTLSAFPYHSSLTL